MYNDQVRVPLVLRTPMGGRRGYGPTHSQTLEKHFLGVPGLGVLAPAPFAAGEQDARTLLQEAILHTEEPLLFVENKLLYLLPAAPNGPISRSAWPLMAPRQPTAWRCAARRPLR